MNKDKNTTNHENSLSEESPNWLFDDISESRAVPAYWDLSELLSNNGYSPGKAFKPPSTPSSTPTQRGELMEDHDLKNTVDDGTPEFCRNPFPEPRTFPFFWDPTK